MELFFSSKSILLVNIQQFNRKRKKKKIRCSGLHVLARIGKCSHLVKVSLRVLLTVSLVSCEAWGIGRGGVVAQLVERRTGTPLRKVRFPGAARDFFLPESTFSADSLTVSVHPRSQSHAFIAMRTLKIP